MTNIPEARRLNKGLLRGDFFERFRRPEESAEVKNQADDDHRAPVVVVTHMVAPQSFEQVVFNLQKNA